MNRLANDDAPFRQHHERVSSLPNLVAALEVSWLQPMIGEAVILNGSGAFLGTGWGGEGSAYNAIRSSEDHLWREYRSLKCSHPWGAEQSASSIGASKKAANNEERLLLNTLGHAWCGAAIQRHETRARQKAGKGSFPDKAAHPSLFLKARKGSLPDKAAHPSLFLQFDLVAFMRPDLLLARPMDPWCTSSGRRAVLACEAAGADGLWVAPRHSMGRLTSQAALHASCAGNGTRTQRVPARSGNPGGKNVFYGNRYGIKISCCGGSEALLAYTLHTQPGASSVAALGCRTLAPFVGTSY